MPVTVEKLQRILLLSALDLDQLAQLQAYAVVKHYSRGEIILHEGDPLVDLIPFHENPDTNSLVFYSFPLRPAPLRPICIKLKVKRY
ncbi:MAG: hypothetical protein RMX68_015680 [Aulosira sp. ZfuVER01]|nr:hypothetical protein [Aulosira sp. DedVER01a]MDZ8052749.1 hypothetical protein [Aulosira sp. ZfuCHP01]